MSTSRQNPEYPMDDSVRDALAIVSAFVHEPDADGDLVELALENALSGTDHTALVFNLGQISRLLLLMAAEGRGEQPEALMRSLAAATGMAIEGNPDEGI